MVNDDGETQDATDAQATESSGEYVTRTAGGGWRLSGTRVSLDSIVHAYAAGRIPEAIVTDFPSLTLEQAYGAIAFYLRHRPTIDKYLADQDKRWEGFQRESAARHSPLLQRIRQSSVPAASPGEIA
jgi:uncharacterized protein (DUF433 family)